MRLKIYEVDIINTDKYKDSVNGEIVEVSKDSMIVKGLDGYIQKVKAKLINYKDNIELEEQKRKDEIELARLKQGNINVSATANNSNEISINITLEQAIECINQIPDDILTKEEKGDLEDKLSGIDTAVKSGKKEKAKEKILAVLKFLIDKGADALIAILPYLAQMAGLIQSV